MSLHREKPSVCERGLSAVCGKKIIVFVRSHREWQKHIGERGEKKNLARSRLAFGSFYNGTTAGMSDGGVYRDDISVKVGALPSKSKNFALPNSCHDGNIVEKTVAFCRENLFLIGKRSGRALFFGNPFGNFTTAHGFTSISPSKIARVRIEDNTIL